MVTRRRATAEELAQGEREMALSQKRLDEQLEKGEELQLEDEQAQKVSEDFKSPKAVRDDAKGSKVGRDQLVPRKPFTRNLLHRNLFKQLR